MKILITGGAGFIGSHLCDALMERGHNLTVVDNLVLGRKENISHLLGKVGFEFIEEDLLHTEAMRDIFKDRKFDMVYHLAANSDIQKGGKDPQVDYDLTFNTTFHVLRYLKEFGIKKFFFASTSAIYGETSDILNENYGLCVLCLIMVRVSWRARHLLVHLASPIIFRLGSLVSLMW